VHIVSGKRTWQHVTKLTSAPVLGITTASTAQLYSELASWSWFSGSRAD
jgi:hypothetical protein